MAATVGSTMNHLPAINDNVFGGVWDSQMDFSFLSTGGGFGDPARSAWFMPFNVNPPEIGADGEIIGFGNYVMDTGGGDGAQLG